MMSSEPPRQRVDRIPRENASPHGASEHALPQLKLACPQCNAWGVVPTKNLHHYFYCRRCDQWYRMVGASFVRVRKPPLVLELQVRTGMSEWRDDRYRAAGPRAALRRWGRWLVGSKYRLGIAGILLIGMVLASVPRFRPAAAEEMVALPNDLEGRVPLWINAWFADDFPRLVQLTAPQYDRQLRQWIAHHPPPRKHDQSDLPQADARVTSIKRQGKEAAEIKAEVNVPGADGRSKRLLVQQTWINTAGTWYFVPPLSASSARR